MIALEMKILPHSQKLFADLATQPPVIQPTRTVTSAVINPPTARVITDQPVKTTQVPSTTVPRTATPNTAAPNTAAQTTQASRIITPRFIDVPEFDQVSDDDLDGDDIIVISCSSSAAFVASVVGTVIIYYIRYRRRLLTHAVQANQLLDLRANLSTAVAPAVPTATHNVATPYANVSGASYLVPVATTPEAVEVSVATETTSLFGESSSISPQPRASTPDSDDPASFYEDITDSSFDSQVTITEVTNHHYSNTNTPPSTPEPLIDLDSTLRPPELSSIHSVASTSDEAPVLSRVGSVAEKLGDEPESTGDVIATNTSPSTPEPLIDLDSTLRPPELSSIHSVASTGDEAPVLSRVGSEAEKLDGEPESTGDVIATTDDGAEANSDEDVTELKTRIQADVTDANPPEPDVQPARRDYNLRSHRKI